MAQVPLKNPRYEAVVFDFDGVLVDSEEIKVKAFEALYAEEGPEIVGEVVRYHRAHFGVSRLMKFKYFEETLLKRPYTPETEEDLARRFSEMVEGQVVGAPWMPGALEFLEHHSRSLPLYVASGTPDGEIQRIVEKRGIRRHFRGVYGSPPDKAGILARIVTQGGFHPERVLMVGDARADHEGAMRAGVVFLGCGRGQDGGLTGPKIPDLTHLESRVFG